MTSSSNDENSAHHSDDDPAAFQSPQKHQIISLQSSAADESLSKRAVHIMNITSGLCADPIYYHSYTVIGNSNTGGGGNILFQLLPAPKGVFASVFQKCIICHQRLGAAGSNNRRECIAATTNATGGMLQCVACGMYAHRSCAFARPTSSLSSDERPPACVVNLVEIQKALGLLVDDNDKPMNTSQSTETTASSPLMQSSVSSSEISWSIFGSKKLSTPMKDYTTTNNNNAHSETTATATTALTSNEEKQIETTTTPPPLTQSMTTIDKTSIQQSLSSSWTIANVVNGYTGKESYEFGDVTKRILFRKQLTSTTATTTIANGGCSTIDEQQQSSAMRNASQSSSSSTSSSSWSIFGITNSSLLTEETKNTTMTNTATETAEEEECRNRDSIATTTSTNVQSSSSSSCSIFGTNPSTTTINGSDGGKGWERISSLSSEDNNANNTQSSVNNEEIAVTDEPTSPLLSSPPPSSSSWSIFGKKSVTTDDAAKEDDISSSNSSICIDDNKKDKINCLEEVNEPIINIVKTKTNDEERQGSVVTPGTVLVSTAKYTAKTTTSTIGTVVGGVAGFAIAGPVGSIVGSQIGRNISTVGITIVESGVGLSLLVVDIAKAANFLPLQSINSENKKERELKLINSTLILVRPDIYVEPIWGEYATEARRLWELKMQNSCSSSSSSSSTSLVSVYNNTNNASTNERQLRYQKDIDIIKADAGELTMKDKIFLLVNRILNDKLSLPGYQYRYLILKHKRRTMFGTNDDDHVAPTADINDDDDNNDKTLLRSCRQDAHGIIKHITATLLEVRPGLASSSTMTELTACAVETLIFVELYEIVSLKL